MDKCLLDTDTLSELLKGRDARVAATAARYRQHMGRYTLSTISVMEVVMGWHKLRREDRVRQFLERVASEEVLALDTAGAEVAGRIYADLERSGQPIGRADPMVAGIALSRHLVLATGNTSHYQRIVELGYDLKLVNWRDEP